MGAQRALLRVEGACSKGSESLKAGGLPLRAKCGLCPRCTRATHALIPATYEVGCMIAARQSQSVCGSCVALWPPVRMPPQRTSISTHTFRPAGIGLRPNMRLRLPPSWIRRPCAPRISRTCRLLNWFWRIHAPSVGRPFPRRQRPRVFLLRRRQRAVSSPPLPFAPRVHPLLPRSRRVPPNPLTQMGNPLGPVRGSPRLSANGHGKEENTK